MSLARCSWAGARGSLVGATYRPAGIGPSSWDRRLGAHVGTCTSAYVVGAELVVSE